MIKDSPSQETSELPQSEVVTTRFSADGSPSTALVSAVASADSRDPANIDPLYGQFDPDALDALLLSGYSGTDDEPLEVEFEFERYLVRMGTDGVITLSK